MSEQPTKRRYTVWSKGRLLGEIEAENGYEARMAASRAYAVPALYLMSRLVSS